MTWVRFPADAGLFLFATASRQVLGAHSAFNPKGTEGGSFIGGTAAGAWSWLLTSI